MIALQNLLIQSEYKLMERILQYAKSQGYSRYTSTLVEPWRISIQGLTDAIVTAILHYGKVLPQFSPQDQFEDDPIAQFGLIEAQLHRERGIDLAMFLGLYKYYRYTYVGLIREASFDDAEKDFYVSFVERCFDRIEIAFCSQWINLGESVALTELQRANRTITNEKNKYLTLFESLDTPAFLIDEQGVLENINISGARLLGLRDVEGAMYYSYGGQLESQYRKQLSTLLPWLEPGLHDVLKKENASLKLEAESRDEMGDRYYSVAISRLRDISGKFRGGIVLLEDVTERKKMEQFKEGVESITRHDLKVPLSGMLGVLNYLLDNGMLNYQQQQMLSMAKKSGYTMLSIINRSLDIVKMEMGRYTYVPNSVDLAIVLRRVMEHLESTAKACGVSVDVSIDGKKMGESTTGPLIVAEEMLVYSALINLLCNAIEASPMEEAVNVDIVTDDMCSIIISNQGVVPEEIRDSFFEKFVSWGKRNGTGLGTYTARLVINTMHGEIMMRTEGDRTFITVELPLSQPFKR
ncbi:sensor histidine kinase [Desulfovibrio inopinatus]|uniref:sensor histidine kinase n=1 Tax=Desulfovibrio inopinatus TaxID=102109 RepID=UPI0003F5040C|nr:HAMP domain-containing sensor histidine kinase [Desulfovibrio inopinatus]